MGEVSEAERVVELWPVEVVLGGKHLFVAYADELDASGRSGYVTGGDGSVVAAPTLDELRRLVLDTGLDARFESEIHAVDVDAVVARFPRRIDADTATMLWDVWSALDDLSTAAGRPMRFRGRDRRRVLDKLFAHLQLDLAGVDHQAGRSVPFTKRDRRKLRQMIVRGAAVSAASTRGRRNLAQKSCA